VAHQPSVRSNALRALAQAAVSPTTVRRRPESESKGRKLPLLIVATSRTDEATGTAFPPVPQSLNALRAGIRRLSAAANIRTIGWESRYKTHEIKVDRPPNPCNTTNTMNFYQRLP